MKRQSQYLVRFSTPAFLGNAEQKGQWRTPPFKAQLRQWWRVAYAAQRGFEVDTQAMRAEEGRLFGNAWLKDAFCKSAVRIRLETWPFGRIKSWQGLAQNKVAHREVEKTGYKVEPHAYLGFGPLVCDKKTHETTLKGNAAIQAGEENTFSLAYPEADAPLIEEALALMSCYGTVGGRSRNGWGSYSLTPVNGTLALPSPQAFRPWQEALRLDWAHAIGQDQDQGQRALIWATAPHADWNSLMRTLAIIKIALRTHFVFSTGSNTRTPEARHWLSYPVTHHTVQDWTMQIRLPNSLRFKVRPTAEGQVEGVIFHMPCQPPLAFQPDLRALVPIWSKVHELLDQNSHLQRISA